MLPVGLGLLLLGCLTSNHVMLLCKYFGDLLVVGESGTKSTLLVATLWAVSVARLLPRLYHQTMRPSALALMGTAYLLAIFEHFSACAQLGISPWRLGCALSLNGSYSTHGALHFHVAKSPLGWLFSGPGKVADLGQPFVPLFSDGLMLFHLCVLCLLYLLLVMALGHTARELPAGDQICLTLAAYAVFKGAVDGGPLGPEVLLGLTPCAYYLGGRRALLGIIPLQLSGLALMSKLGPGFYFKAFQCSTVALVLATPFLVQRLWDSRRRGAWAVLGLSLTLMVLAPLWEYSSQPYVHAVPRALTLWAYGHHPLAQSSTFYVAAPHELKSAHPGFSLALAHEFNRFRIYRATAERELTVFEVCALTGTNLFRRPVTWNTDPVYFRTVGVLFDEWPADWPLPAVSKYRCSAEGSKTTLELLLPPGSNLGVLIETLPPGLFLMLRKPTVPGRPESGPWLSGAGDRPTLPRGRLGSRPDPGR